MSELFGAPSGIIASDENIRSNVREGLLAQKTLGEIEQQPAELALKQQQTRLYGAEASEQETAAALAQQSLEWDKKFAQDRLETAARGQLVTGIPSTQGRDATVGDLPPDGKAARLSGADLMIQKADWLDAHNAPLSLTVPLRKEIAAIQEHEGIAHYRNSQAADEALKQQQTQLKLVGQVAGSAATSPQAYFAMIHDPQGAAILKNLGLTGNYTTDKPTLEAVAKASMDAHEQAELKRQMADDASKQALRAAETAQANQRISLMKQRELDLQTAADTRAKYDGAKSKSAKDANDARIKASEARVFSEQLKFAPMLKLDPSKVEVGKLYTLQDKSLVRITGKDANGNPVGEPVGKDEARQMRVDAVKKQRTGEEDTPVNVE